mgnify:CR=1 FL=1
MSEVLRKVETAKEFIAALTDFRPQIGIILGTGLGKLASEIEAVITLPYHGVPSFPLSTVESHEGRLILGNLSGKRVLALQGRFHSYEGYSMEEIVLPVRVMKVMGAQVLIVSNASGGLNPFFQAGDLMAIVDHINFMGENPLRGRNEESLGPRFPDMYHAYDPALLRLAEEIALEEGILLRKGTYVAMPGPSLETAAEYRMLRTIGADAVGMSTVPEVIAARHLGMRVLGLSIITDMCLPDDLEPVNFEKIVDVANRSEPKLTVLVERVIERTELG